MTNSIRLGIAGLGTVGVGVMRIMQNNSDILNSRSGVSILVSAVNARSQHKDRGIDLSDYSWENDPVALARRDDVDIFVELIGGDSGPAKDAIEAALKAGKDVITANKALLAIHGQALAELAEQNGCVIRYEAAVAGGIPIIKTLSEGLAGNKIERVMGVMNGSCNYILTRMEDAGLTYEEVFDEANALGYLEADPNLDVGGIDAAHKLAILSSIAFGTQVNFAGITIEGIQNVTIEDIKYAAKMGYKIKLLGVAQHTEQGLEQRMTPCLVPDTSPLGQLQGGTNLVVVEGDSIGQVALRGAGAGEGPTASAVVGDVIDIARRFRMPVFGQPAASLSPVQIATTSAPAPYYIRIRLKDQAGALAQLAATLGDSGISIDQMRQTHQFEQNATVVIVTHDTTQACLDNCLTQLNALDVVTHQGVAIRIENL